MNSRIEALLKESTNDILGVPVVDQEKFARAIIQDCVDILSDYSGKVIWDDHSTQNGNHPIVAIKKNFGVEL